MKKGTMIPLHDRVIIKREEPEGKSKGGILIPETTQKKPQRGEVLAAGEGKLLDSGERAPMSVKAGDVIMFGAWSGSEVEIDGETYLIMSETDILCKVL